MKISINIKILLYVILLFLFLFFITGFLYFSQYKKRLIDNLKEQANLIVKISDLNIVNDLNKYNDIALLSHLEKLESLENILNVVILSNNGTVLANTDVYEMGLQYTDKVTNWVINLKRFSFMDSIENGKNVIVFASPLVDKELGIVAFIKFSISKDIYFSNLKKEYKYFFMITFIFISIFIILFYIFFYNFISHPISLMKDGLKLMLDKIDRFKFNIKSKDEIGGVYDNINNLIEKFLNILNEKDLSKNLLIDNEEKRFEELVKNLFKESNVLISDANNKIIFEQILYKDLFKSGCKGIHFLDALNDSDLISFLTESYSNKENIYKKDFFINSEKFFITMIFIKDNNLLINKTIFILDK